MTGANEMPSAEGDRIRPFVRSNGRTRPDDVEVEPLSIVEAIGSGPDVATHPDEAQVHASCRKPMSVIEIATQHHLPVLVVAVIAADLRKRKLVHVSKPYRMDDLPSMDVLEAVIAGLRAIP